MATDRTLVQQLADALEYRMSWIHDDRHSHLAAEWKYCQHGRCVETRDLVRRARATTDDTITIQNLTPLAFSRALSIALAPAGAIDVGWVADFLAMVDWSGKDAEKSEMAEMVGRLQYWLGEYSEAGLSMEAFRANVTEMFFTMGGKAELVHEQGKDIRVEFVAVASTQATGTRRRR